MEQFHVQVSGLEQLHAQMDKAAGWLIFGSHWAASMRCGCWPRSVPDVQVRVVLDKAQAPALTELLGALNPQLAERIIDAGMDSTSIVMAIKQATDAGHLVALLVDRTRPEDPFLPAQFLGAQAQFPTSPWLIAAVLKVPVVLAFGLYHGGARYALAFETYSEGLEVSRRNRAACLGVLIRGYAERLEHYARYAPYNWFNFYDFWNAKHDQGKLHLEPGADADAAVQRRTAVRRIA